MKIRKLAVLALTAASLAGFQGQAHAMGLLVGLTNSNIQVVALEDGTLTLIENTTEGQTEIASAELNKTEPAAGE